MSFEYQFPNPRTADPDGLLAVGGDLSVSALVTAYSQGIFPWFSDNSPILWWSPNPRLVLFPSDFKVTSSLRQRINNKKYSVTVDTDFETVIRQCAQVTRREQEGTWITSEMIDAYIELHRHGLAHSFETRINGEIVGGLYGVSLGRVFFGESMFHLMPDTSKIALNALVNWCVAHDFLFIDAQQSTSHMKSMGAKEISRDGFLKFLKIALKKDTIQNKWTMI